MKLKSIAAFILGSTYTIVYYSPNTIAIMLIRFSFRTKIFKHIIYKKHTETGIILKR